MELDLNSDLGEGCATDAEVLPLVTSANVACGFHAGDAVTAHATLRVAKQHGVAAGAHPGFADREHFGRRELSMTERQIYDECVYQVGALSGLARAAAVTLRHLKPHGALYNMACREERYARPIVEAAALFGLMVLGLPGSSLAEACRGHCRFVAEGFADRRYQPDGSLVPRSRPDAFVASPEEAVEQAEWLMRDRGVQTLCVHGDNPEALAFVKALRAALKERGITVRKFA